MKTRLLLVSALALVTVQGIAQAAPAAASDAELQAHAQRMALIGRTVRAGEAPAAPVSTTPEALTAEAHAQRMALIGLTPRAGELPAAPVKADVAKNDAERAQLAARRLALIGQPAQARDVRAMGSMQVQAGH